MWRPIIILRSTPRSFAWEHGMGRATGLCTIGTEGISACPNRGCRWGSQSGAHIRGAFICYGTFVSLERFQSSFHRRGTLMAKVTKLKPREGRAMAAALDTPTDISAQAVKELSKALNGLLADTFALYLKTKNFHWHVSGPHFRSYHLLLDEQATEIYDTTDAIAERVRKLGGTTLRSISDITRNQTLKDNNDDFVPPLEMLRELMNDNKATIASMRKIHELCDKHDDVATASLLENFID